MITTLTGTLVNARRYAFDDEKSGRKVQGVSINVLVPQSPQQQSDDFIGDQIVKVSGPYDLFASLKPDMFGKLVNINCNVKVSATATKLEAASIKAA